MFWLSLVLSRVGVCQVLLSKPRHLWTIIVVKNHVSRLHLIFIYDFKVVKFIRHYSYRIDDVPWLPRLRSRDVAILFKFSIT